MQRMRSSFSAIVSLRSLLSSTSRMTRLSGKCFTQYLSEMGSTAKKIAAYFFLGKYLQILGGDFNSPHFFEA